MDSLRQFYHKLDQNDWDAKDIHVIEEFLDKLYKGLPEQEQKSQRVNFKREQEAFAFNKSPEKRLSYKFQFENKRKLEDGSEVPYEWPDLRTFTEDDFTYILQRFETCKNVFAKTEYGLVLYYADRLVQNEGVYVLLQNLFELAKKYIEKAKANNEKNFYILYFHTVLANALYIAEKRKSDSKIGLLYKELITFTFHVHQNWDITHRSSLRTIIDLTNFAIEYLKDFKSLIDVTLFDKKNWEVAEFLSNTYEWGAIYVSDISMRLCRKSNLDIKKWLHFKAAQYEKLSSKSQSQNNLAAISFIEKAMEIYRGLKDESNFARLQTEYQTLRSTFKMGSIKQEIPQDENQRITALIKKEISESTVEEIIKTLTLTPMIRPIAEIKKWSEESFNETPFLNNASTNVIDKFGNKIAQYTTEKARKEFAELRAYDFFLRLSLHTLLQYFVEALRADKISSEGIMRILKQTWLGQVGTRIIDGRDVHYSHLRLLESGIQSMFSELSQWKASPEYLPNLVSATDSLVLKVEYLLREFCYHLGIPTFKQNEKEKGIIMERNIVDLLKDLKEHLNENDHYFIKFILTEKAGYNLRNRVAHGLMDDVDYGLEYPVLALIIILKLSNYQFVPTVKSHEHEAEKSKNEIC